MEDQASSEERTLSGNRYRVIIIPFGPEAPLGPAVCVMVLRNNQWVPIYEHQQRSYETNEDVFRLAWAVAEKHASRNEYLTNPT